MNKYRMEPLPDVMIAKDGTVFNPNKPSTTHHEVPDRRPQVMYADYEFSEEYWTKRLNAKKAEVNGKALDNRRPTC